MSSEPVQQNGLFGQGYLKACVTEDVPSNLKWRQSEKTVYLGSEGLLFTLTYRVRVLLHFKPGLAFNRKNRFFRCIF